MDPYCFTESCISEDPEALEMWKGWRKPRKWFGKIAAGKELFAVAAVSEEQNGL